MSSPSIASLVLCGLLVYTAYRVVIYPLFLSPLSKLPPAHPTATISPLWILYIRRTGWENRTVLAAHKRLGPVIRLGPNEISVNCVDGGIRSVSLDEFFYFEPQEIQTL